MACGGATGPARCGPSRCSVAVSHRLVDPSAAATASTRPSGPKATPLTAEMPLPDKVKPSGPTMAASHTATELLVGVTRSELPGTERICSTAPCWPTRGHLTRRFEGAGVPQLGGAVLAPGGEQLPVGAEGDPARRRSHLETRKPDACREHPADRL
jgi:hypothetical protein